MGAITNIAYNVYSIRREIAEGDEKTKIRCLKNRAFGVKGEVALCFNERGRRFSEMYAEPKSFGWAAAYLSDKEKEKEGA